MVAPMQSRCGIFGGCLGLQESPVGLSLSSSQVDLPFPNSQAAVGVEVL